MWYGNVGALSSPSSCSTFLFHEFRSKRQLARYCPSLGLFGFLNSGYERVPRSPPTSRLVAMPYIRRR